MNLDGEDDDDVTITTITTESEINGNIPSKSLKLKVPSSNCSISSQSTPLTGCSSIATGAFTFPNASPIKSKLVKKSKTNKLVRTSSLSSTVSAYNSGDDLSIVDTSKKGQVKAKVKGQKYGEHPMKIEEMDPTHNQNATDKDKSKGLTIPTTGILSFENEKSKADKVASGISVKCVSFKLNAEQKKPSAIVSDTILTPKTDLTLILPSAVNNDHSSK